MTGKADAGPSVKEKTERDARWMSDFSDDLTVAIALRKWDRAVALVEEGISLMQCHFPMKS
jgi:exocyst complex component 8